MTYMKYRKSMEREQRWLCFLIAVLAAAEMFFAIPAEQVIAEVRNSDSRCRIRQEIWIIPTEN